MKASLISGLLAITADASPWAWQKLQPREPFPVITLPSGKYRAVNYDARHNIWVFKNIRYAAPPVGQLRWAKPARPADNDTLQSSQYGPACYQALPAQFLLGNGLFGNLVSSLISWLDIGKYATSASEASEDCLFLDIYVPGKVLKSNEKVPIANWIHAGAFVRGSKDIYDGLPIVARSGGNIVHVIANYRVGAFGFLAGSTMEKEGLPNAGLWDQRAVLEWIQEFGPAFGGDPNQVTLWGQSAGGGSIYHHLTMFGGTKPALFKRAILQSPAAEMLGDRTGMLEREFKRFAKYANCEGQGVACLRSASFDTLKKAHDKFFAEHTLGNPGFGPAADGNMVRQLPVLEMATGNVVKGVEAIINSHMTDEARVFTRRNMTNEKFEQHLNFYFESSPTVKDAFKKKYAQIANPDLRMHEFMTQSVFTCNNRWITEAFKGKSYNGQYGRGSGDHGEDLGATFYYEENHNWMSPALIGDEALRDFAPRYQRYMSSLITTGSPNRKKDELLPEWPLAEVGPTIKNVLNVTNGGYTIVEDKTNTAEWCDFLRDALGGLTANQGLSPPGAVYNSTLINRSVDPSAHFKT